MLTPARSGSRWRTMSPSGGSTLTTSAPASASIRVHIGPDITIVKSTTRKPASAGSRAVCCGAVSRLSSGNGAAGPAPAAPFAPSVSLIGRTPACDAP